ncbi:helix-turn-helix domain-containing protein [Bradyrhizobium ontarionense]|uniref:Helix-turn-helix domain-containing protein n=1 Tax=Bradyrhizobium ontarionense TaxID=2898149 RepID=A0ABY3R4W5_9BRAD|nr:helix-turn-helix domain-containing protein [Bradyrhizobium sp. A19]UFZ02345.1 helix-turn-helix domain-containing protein [Bradyrhizobium sp. A19]
MKPLKIGALARQTGTSAPTIRYYEEIGLLPSAGRQAGNQRIYGEADVRSLTFIRRCREFGFSIGQVRELVALGRDPKSSCADARDLAQEHLQTVRAKLAELKALERSIAALIVSCDASCAGGPGPECVILDDLSKARPRVSRTSSGRAKSGACS